jgi:hypothetical protein
MHGQLDVDLLGKPALEWSDDDIATALMVFRIVKQKRFPR